MAYLKISPSIIKRIKKGKEDFISFYGEEPSDVFTSPGRVEVLGNHTDHNHGKVIVSSINLNFVALVKKNKDNKIRYHSEKFPLIEVDLNNLSLKEEEQGKSISLIRGIAFKFHEANYNLGGFDIEANSTIFKGAGVSSSAAFEMLIAKILAYYYNDDKIDQIELAKIGQFAESVYFNKPCGLLDQTGISVGYINYIDFKDVNNPVVKKIDKTLKSYDTVIVNTGGSHSGLINRYANIKNSMLKIASYFKKDNLREVDEKEFYLKKDELIKLFGEYAFNTAIHFFNENKRVDEAYKALMNHDEKTFIKLINESGESSYHYLKNGYVDNEEENLPHAIKISKEIIKDGAVRIHGGGFVGTIIAYINHNETENYINKMRQEFGKYNVRMIKLGRSGSLHLGSIRELGDLIDG